MKITCLIDSLGSGGAQRQMTCLVRALKNAGFEVQLVIYHDQFMHFLPDIVECGVQPVCIHWSTKRELVSKIRTAVRSSSSELIISFLSTPNMLAVLASLGGSRIPVIVSERSLHTGKLGWETKLRFQVYRFADRVVANSHAQADFINQHFSFLKHRTTVIRNCVDLELFKPRSRKSGESVRILVAASVTPVKNAHRLIEAAHTANQLSSRQICIDWYGNNLFRAGKPTPGSQYYLDAIKLVDNLGASHAFSFHPTVSDLHSRFCEYDALCLPSLYEGCPNIVCEAMASGLPVLSSRVSDLQATLGDESKLFDPSDVKSISRVLLDFAASSDSERLKCGQRNRRYAEHHFSPARFGREFCQLIDSVLK